MTMDRGDTADDNHILPMPREVDIWLLDLKKLPHEALSGDDCISPDEFAESDRFHFHSDRALYRVYRGFVRKVLSRYARVHPRRLVFGRENREKPILHTRDDERDIHFNLTHSGDLAALAVSTCEVGIDIEEIKKPRKQDDIIEWACTKEEKRFLSLFPEDERIIHFFTLWARKEACIKAHAGRALSDLQEYQIVTESGNGSWLYLDRFYIEKTAWTLVTPCTIDGYAAALCTRCEDPAVKMFTFHDSVFPPA